jgi:hypothetical protein
MGAAARVEVPMAIPELSLSPATDDDARVLRCQVCGAQPARFNEYMWVTSFLVATRHLAYDACLCRRCSTRVGLRELVKSALFGWWGFPWGILTFGALAKNVRSLLVWSTLPKVSVVGLVALGLAVPGAVVTYFYLDSQKITAAKQSGDWGPEEVSRLVDRGHELFEHGQAAKALEVYRQAYQKARGSSVVNFSLAATHVALGDLAAAMPFAVRAEELDPRDAGYTALHGWLLHQTGDVAGARAKAASLPGLEVEEPGDAAWIVELHQVLEDWEALDAAAAAGAAAFPDDPYLPAVRLLALLAKDDLAGYETAVAALPEAARAHREAVAAAELYALRKDPASGLDAVLARWAGDGYSPMTMQQMVIAAERAGALDATRQRVLDWARAAATPSHVWGQMDA